MAFLKIILKIDSYFIKYLKESNVRINIFPRMFFLDMILPARFHQKWSGCEHKWVYYDYENEVYCLSVVIITKRYE